MKIELISPFVVDPGNVGKNFQVPPIALTLLARITPADVDLSITDELVQPIDFDKEVDLVGITVSTKTVSRAYKIADEFRRRNVPVVLGGIHPTVAPNEAIQHADAVVIGEAEDVWTQLLEDFKYGKLNGFYRSNMFPNLKNYPVPRRELLQRNKYITLNLVQTSRGCPFDCSFCSVSSINGRGIRLRPVDDVISEIKTLRGSDLFFIDDNIVGKPKYAKQLFTKLIPLNKKWIGQASVTAALSEEILKLLNKSGCQGLLVGFETTSTSTLSEIGKRQNINNNYFETIKKLHDYGISIAGSFVMGFDSDDKNCFQNLLEFSVKSAVDVGIFSILTPYPGTALYEKMKEEGRLIDDEWWLKPDTYDVAFRPKLMTREELYQGWVWTMKEFYKYRPTLKRLVKGIGRRSLFGNILCWKVNMGYRGTYALHENNVNPRFAYGPVQEKNLKAQ